MPRKSKHREKNLTDLQFLQEDLKKKEKKKRLAQLTFLLFLLTYHYNLEFSHNQSYFSVKTVAGATEIHLNSYYNACFYKATFQYTAVVRGMLQNESIV